MEKVRLKLRVHKRIHIHNHSNYDNDRVDQQNF
jgi:hypothetical protein